MRRLVWIVPASVLLSGCANFFGFDASTGLAKNDVLARWGQPQAVYPLGNGGERLQYSLQPLGRSAWMIDVDSGGRVVSARQVLSEENFYRIVPGQWTLADVEREFGPPALIENVPRWNGTVLTYRWRDVTHFDLSYSIYLDRDNVVQRAHPWMEHLGGPSERS